MLAAQWLELWVVLAHEVARSGAKISVGASARDCEMLDGPAGSEADEAAAAIAKARAEAEEVERAVVQFNIAHSPIYRAVSEAVAEAASAKAEAEEVERAVVEFNIAHSPLYRALTWKGALGFTVEEQKDGRNEEKAVWCNGSIGHM